MYYSPGLILFISYARLPDTFLRDTVQPHQYYLDTLLVCHVILNPNKKNLSYKHPTTKKHPYTYHLHTSNHMATSAARSSVLGGYRRLLRLRKRVFVGDQYAIDQARVQLRLEFLKHKDVRDTQELAGLVKGIEEVEEMFTMNIVQGKLNQEGNYEVKLRPEQHLKDKEHEMVTHVDDRLVNDNVVVERTTVQKEGRGGGSGGGCCGGGCGDSSKK